MPLYSLKKRKNKLLKPYAMFSYGLFAITLSWIAFCNYKINFDGWTTTDVANWSQIISVYELVIAFGLALWSDHRIITQIENDKEIERKQRHDKSFGLIYDFSRRVLGYMNDKWTDDIELKHLEDPSYILVEPEWRVMEPLLGHIREFYKEFSYLNEPQQRLITSLSETLKSIRQLVDLMQTHMTNHVLSECEELSNAKPTKSALDGQERLNKVRDEQLSKLQLDIRRQAQILKSLVLTTRDQTNNTIAAFILGKAS